MVDSKKKLKTPTPYSGKREDLQKFLQEVKIYLLANEDSYPENLDKILFVLSYMSEGDANSWKEEYIDSIEQKAARDNAALNFGDYKTFITKITDDFSPYDAPKDAIYAMREMELGSTSIEEQVAKFKMLVNQSKLAKNDAVIEYFRETLPQALQREILKLPEQPTNLDDWYKWAIKLQNNFMRMRSTIAWTKARGGQLNTQNTRGGNTNRQGGQNPRRFYFEPPKDPNAMDIDFMSTEERAEYMKKGLCFRCRQPGHRANDPTFHPKQQRGTFTPLQKLKMTGKELHAHVRTLMAQMDDQEKEDFYQDASKEGF